LENLDLVWLNSKKQMKKLNLVVLSSSGGGNFQVLIENQNIVGYKIIYLIVDRNCNAINKAIDANIPYIKINKIDLIKHIPQETDLIVSAGYMSIIDNDTCYKWDGKIINTHPSLLPKYGGKGMIGVKVQEAVLAAKDEYAGCTIHYVDSGIDTGKIILQEKIKIDYTKTAWELGGNIHKIENKLLLEAIKLIGENDGKRL